MDFKSKLPYTILVTWLLCCVYALPTTIFHPRATILLPILVLKESEVAIIWCVVEETGKFFSGSTRLVVVVGGVPKKSNTFLKT